MSNSIQVIIADDNRFFCEALQDSLNKHDEIVVKNTFTTIEDVIEYTNNHYLDILILDVNFNGKSSLDYISKMKETNSDFKIISLTTMNNNFIKNNAYTKGIDLFIGKDSDLSNFKNEILNCFNTKSKTETITEKKIIIGNRVFTQRKLEVLRTLYIHSDKTEKELSEILNISGSALKFHKRNLFEITNTKNATELIKFGIQNGLILP